MPVAARETKQNLPEPRSGDLALRLDGQRRRSGRRRRGSRSPPQKKVFMPREFIILECTEAKALGKPVSRYISTRNKKSPNTPNRLEKKKYNPPLRRHTLHRETR